MAAHNDAAKRESAGPHKTSRLAPSRSSFPPAAVRDIFAEETEQFGTPLNTTMVWAHHPILLAAYRAFRKAMNEASLIPDGLKYLVYVRVASLNGCPFWVDINTASGQAAGIEDNKFAHLSDYETHPAFTTLERMVLSYADGMTISGRDTSDELFAALREHFSAEEMVELTAHVAFENFRSRFNHAFRIQAQGFCRLPR